jgi:CelD/BcsL family acetyltransferase involved in cellulose biosynthesis
VQATAWLGGEVRQFERSDAAVARPLDAPVSVDVLDGAALHDLDDAWRDLLDRADEPNVFMAPRLLRHAAESGMRVVALLAWQRSANERRLAGIWGFSVGRPRHAIVPLVALRAPAPEHAYLATPVIDRNCLDATLDTMFDAVASARHLPKSIVLNAMSAEGATAEALLRVLAKRGSTYVRLKEAKRPKLVTGADPNDYLTQALSSSTRKKLRQHRRRLAERGELKSVVVSAPDDVQKAVDAFLQLEAEGWKGRRGTALLNSPRDAAFARSMLTAFARSGEAFIHALELDGRPVSMQVVLRAGPAAFTWKTAYDEALRDVSPGMLLFEDYTKAFLESGEIASVDSCAYDETSFMAGWQERQAVADLMICAKRGRSPGMACAASVNRHYGAAREAAKQTLQRARSAKPSIKSLLARLRVADTRAAS